MSRMLVKNSGWRVGFEPSTSTLHLNPTKFRREIIRVPGIEMKKTLVLTT